MIVFEVYDSGKLAGYPYQNVSKDWIQPTFLTFEKAQVYAKNWLGEYSSLCPIEPNRIVYYSVEGDFIEIREITKE
jgi:hypothetical protein